MTDREDGRRAYRRLLQAGRAVPSLSDATWVSLLRAYLNAERRAHWVINDFLRELKQPPIKPGGTEERVRRVLGVLPPQVGHELGLRFAEHAYAPIGGPSPELAVGMEIKRSWLAGEATDAQLAHARRGATRAHDPLRNVVLSASAQPFVVQRMAAQAVRRRAASIVESTEPRHRFYRMENAEHPKAVAWQHATLRRALEAPR